MILKPQYHRDKVPKKGNTIQYREYHNKTAKKEKYIKIQSRQNLLPNPNKNVCNHTSILKDNRRRHNSLYKIILATLLLDAPVKFCDGNLRTSVVKN